MRWVCGRWGRRRAIISQPENGGWDLRPSGDWRAAGIRGAGTGSPEWSCGGAG